eukprot:12917435-Prorocentrum_lima.AAC.1
MLKDDDEIPGFIDYIKTTITSDGLPTYCQRSQGFSRGSLQLPRNLAYRVLNGVAIAAGDAVPRMTT